MFIYPRKKFWKNSQQIKVDVFREEDWMESGGKGHSLTSITSVFLQFYK